MSTTQNTDITLNNGVVMPAIGFGVFQTPPEETKTAVAEALRVGYRHIDTAAAYSNERGVGEAIAESGIPRDDIFIETKIWISDFGYDETLHAFEKATGKLGIDTIDLLAAERGEPIDVNRNQSLDWQPVRDAIREHGMRNSNVMAIAPTATIANIQGVTQSIEPLYTNLFVKSNLSGEFTIVNESLVDELDAAGLWDQDLLDEIKYWDGSIAQSSAFLKIFVAGTQPRLRSNLSG